MADVAAINGGSGIPAQSKVPQAADAISRKAEEFEAMFLGAFVNEMMKDSMPKTMNGGHGEEVFHSFLGNEIGAQMARNGDYGIAESVERAMRAYGK